MNNRKILNLCKTNGFCLKESPLKGRLVAVLLNPKIILKEDLEEKRKESLAHFSISHLLNCPNCRLAIFWRGKREFFHL